MRCLEGCAGVAWQRSRAAPFNPAPMSLREWREERWPRSEVLFKGARWWWIGRDRSSWVAGTRRIVDDKARYGGVDWNFCEG
jgi:hypothetical protein